MTHAEMTALEEQRRRERAAIRPFPQFKQQPALTNEQLEALRTAAIEKGSPLTDDERYLILGY
jgi:hypothetical protein